METNYDPRVDAYIAKSAPFAQPILQHLRQLVHTAAPMAAETIKWGFPFFEYKGSVCEMASFKQHMAFGFWKARQLNDPGKLLQQEEPAAGSFGKITSLADLPSDDILVDFIKQAIQLNEADKAVPVKKETPPKAPKAAIEMPVDFADLLAANPIAQAVYEKFSPSHKREYLEWIVDAKSEETRNKRLETAVEQISEGKSKNWKYQR
jgi:uncharacterized protein YdeI (YjbR/CyaY-like superfamily)